MMPTPPKTVDMAGIIAGVAKALEAVPGQVSSVTAELEEYSDGKRTVEIKATVQVAGVRRSRKATATGLGHDPDA